MFPFVKIANENFFHTWLAEKGKGEREKERVREKRDRLDCGGLKKNPKSRRFFNYMPPPSFQTHEPMHDVRCMYICMHARNVSD